MKLLQFTEYGRPDAIRLVEKPDPVAGPGEVVVELEVAALNPSDFMILDGQYAIRPALPSGIGSEGVGHISSTGAGVRSFSAGDRVLIVPSASRGTWAEKTVVNADQVIPVADGTDGQQLSMAGINGLTAVLLLRYGTLTSGEWLAQTAANSGLGAFTRALAVSKGLNVLDVVRRPDVADKLRSTGAQAVVVAGSDLADQARAILGNQKLSLVLDGVGGDSVGQLAALIRPDGHIVSYAALGGQPVAIHPMSLIISNLHLHGLWLERWLQDAPYEDIASAYHEIAPLLADGTLHAPVAATYPLEHFKEALRESRTYHRDGKILFTFTS